ncbi:5253_t:CDS:2, partial [Racocetra fulgida]
INEEHSFHIDVDITISHYLSQLADFLCDDNNIINVHEMLHPSDDNSRHIDNISEGQYIADYLHEILKLNFKLNKYNLFSFPY